MAYSGLRLGLFGDEVHTRDVESLVGWCCFPSSGGEAARHFLLEKVGFLRRHVAKRDAMVEGRRRTRSPLASRALSYPLKHARRRPSGPPGWEVRAEAVAERYAASSSVRGGGRIGARRPREI